MSSDIDLIAKKYSGFAAPLNKVVVGGTDISKSFILDTVTVELTSTYEASACTFTVRNGFETGDDDVSTKIKLGDDVTVSVGYADTLEEVFTGYVDSVKLEHTKSQGVSFHVFCMDAKGIMMNTYRSELKNEIDKFSDAAAKVFEDYPRLIKETDIAATQKITSRIEQHNESDYSFIVRLAKKLNYCFYILNGKAYFKQNDKKKATSLTMPKSKYVQGFAVEFSLKNRVSSVTVRANDELNPKKPFQGKSETFKSITEGKEITPTQPSVITKKINRVLYDPLAESDAAAKSIADAKMFELSLSYCTGTLTTIGIPDVLPGTNVEIKGYGETFDKLYYISKVTHKMNKNGFVTVCHIGANC